MKTLFKILPSLVISGSMALHGSMAFARNDGSNSAPYDSKKYAASECMPYGSGNQGFTQYAGYIKNRTNGTVTVVCPIVRERPAYTFYNEYPQEINYFGIRVSFYGESYSKANTCTLYHYSNDGKFLNSKTRKTTFGSDQVSIYQYQIIRSEGAFSLLCDIPPGGYLYNYRVDESLGG